MKRFVGPRLKLTSRLSRGSTHAASRGWRCHRQGTLAFVLVATSTLSACVASPDAKDEWSTSSTVVDAPRAKRFLVTTDIVEGEARDAPNASVCIVDAELTHRRHGADLGYFHLEACVRRDDFHQLRALLRAPWVDELRHRRSAGIVLARVLARRGGSLAGDLELIHRRRLPIFGLNEALASPSLYTGRLVVFRGVVDDAARTAEGMTFHIYESDVVGLPVVGSPVVGFPVVGSPVDEFAADEPSVASFRRRAATRQGFDLAAVDVADERQSAVGRRSHRTVNVDEETGTMVIATSKLVDPFVRPNVPLLFLTRFASADVVVDDDGIADPEARHGLVELVATFDTHAWGIE